MGLIGRKANFDSVGCTERAEDRKTKQSHPKKEGGSQEGREGEQQKEWFAPVTKNYSIRENFAL